MSAQSAQRIEATQPAPAQPSPAGVLVAVEEAPAAQNDATDRAGISRKSERRADGRRLQGRSLLTANWSRMPIVFGAGGAGSGLSLLTLPELPALVFLLAAILIPFANTRTIDFEKHRPANTARSIALAAMVVCLPMLCFGLSVALWTSQSAVPTWERVIGLPIVVGAIAAIILSRRIPLGIMAMCALWTGMVAVTGSLTSWLALATGITAGVYTALRQTREDALADERRLDRRRAQDRAQEILEDYEQTGQGWFWETDRRGNLVYLSPTLGAVLRREPSGLVGRPFSELFAADPAGQENERTLAFHLTARSAFGELALRAATPGEERWWSLNGRPLYDGFGNFVGFRGSGSDLTEKRRSAEHVSRLAHYDSLTGLANRLQMSQTLEKILTAPNLDHRACSVFLLDLDRFKQVNDTMGHPAGDTLLTQVASRLERAVGEHGRVGRLGGDEFQVVLAGHHRREDLAQLATRVIRDLSEPYSIEGHRVVIGVSIGIAVSPEDGVTSEAIIRNADLALYAAKDGGRGRHHFYAADLHSDAEERRQLEQDLRDALSQGGLDLHYQPVVHTVTERITGFEALLRWHHPTLGPLSPAKFVPIAEDAGLIAPIGEWALRKACTDLAQWPESVRVAVNVSPLQFANPALPAIITNALAAAQVNPARLELEITESVFLNDDAGTEAMFTALKRVGVRLALDDFGTGYSSLGYLKKAPFDKIKIDQSFVRGATITGSRNGAIIASIVSLAEALNMETTAEGVETLDELDLVRMLGCSHVQGFIYAKPLSLGEATQQLETGLTAIAKGPRAARAVRHTMLRKIVLDHGGQSYHGTIRNISATGAMVEGLWNVPPGTIFRIMLAEGQIITATARWCQEDRMGVEFASPLTMDDAGRISVLAHGSAERGRPSIVRREAGGVA